MPNKKLRDSNIELLRIISMVMIVCHHFAVHSGFYFSSPYVTGNMLFLQGLSLGGKIGVDLFVLISGYFLVTAPGLRLKKLLRFWGQIFCYSLVIYLLCALTGLIEFTGAGLLEAVLPILSGQWWFAGAYFALYLLSPLLNRLLGRLSDKQQLLLIGVQAVLWYILPVFTWLPERLRDVLWFVFLYCIAGSLRLHNIAGKKPAKTWFTLGSAALLVSYGWAIVQLWFMAGSRERYETAYFQTWDPLMLLTAIPLFLGFAALKMKPSARINAAAAASFGIYLIHDSNHLRYPLWQGLLKGAALADSPLLIPCALIAIAAVFGVCLVLVLIAESSFKRPAAHS